MHSRLRQLVALTLTVQVLLVGALGTGLHDLLGCQHGRCVDSCCSVLTKDTPASCCGFCCCRLELAEVGSSTECLPHADRPNDAADWLWLSSAECDDCPLCDLLEQFHQATPVWKSSLEVELAIHEAELLRDNAVIAASLRLAFSRGPPAA